MKDYCGENIKKDRCATACMLLFGFLICLAVSVFSIKKLIEGGFQTALFVVVVVAVLTLLVLIVFLLKKPLETKNLNFVKSILKQCADKGLNSPIDSIFAEINADLNQNGKTIGSVLAGTKWLLGKESKGKIPQAINLTLLKGFASGRLHTDNKKIRPAVILVSDVLGAVTFYCSESEQQQFYTYLKGRFPDLNAMDTENIDLSPWLLKNFVFKQKIGGLH